MKKRMALSLIMLLSSFAFAKPLHTPQNGFLVYKSGYNNFPERQVSVANYSMHYQTFTIKVTGAERLYGGVCYTGSAIVKCPQHEIRVAIGEMVSCTLGQDESVILTAAADTTTNIAEDRCEVIKGSYYLIPTT